MNLDLRHLRAFSTLGKELHFGRAAEVLHVSQPALTNTIKQLEAQIGAPLLICSNPSSRINRSGTGITHRNSGYWYAD